MSALCAAGVSKITSHKIMLRSAVAFFEKKKLFISADVSLFLRPKNERYLYGSVLSAFVFTIP
jgi:hypothetical protein